jgi:hypothetical protein
LIFSTALKGFDMIRLILSLSQCQILKLSFGHRLDNRFPSPRFAAKAAPATICRTLDFAAYSSPFTFAPQFRALIITPSLTAPTSKVQRGAPAIATA